MASGSMELATSASSAKPIVEPVEVAASGGLTADDLAELMRTFNEVTSQLHATHAQLQSEVSRLQGELQEANEQIHRSKRLAALGEMAAGIAHEIRNPLGSIALDAEMLREDLTERPEERRLAERMGESVHRLNAIVTDVLSFARDIEPRLETCDAGDLFDRAVEACWAELSGACESRSAQNQVRVERCPDADAIALQADALLTHQALVNLIRNAVEAMTEGSDGSYDGRERTPAADPTLRLEAEHVADGGVRLRVIDNGPGAPREVIDRMFNPFFTTRASGTGLGLAIVHRIADAHGGSVEVRTGLDGGGRGTSVELKLPAAMSVGVDLDGVADRVLGRKECA